MDYSFHFVLSPSIVHILCAYPSGENSAQSLWGRAELVRRLKSDLLSAKQYWASGVGEE